ncbi:hypothetical protein PHMEG_00014135 [Phytophthora megakarya]|uniref:Mucin n=1 Tax=Phytophthora megakarya TaxID=4795 RepID=A0A225W538_9STRA|nr:hypothetical protein PHMEG_00014135 [Phytophthora megakarya]
MTTPHYDYGLDCWAISVEHDATYCIDGPICSGSGTTPAGTLCPVKGDVAIADCHSYLESYTGGQHCVLPVDATCQVIKTGAWGCVLSGSSTPAPTKTSMKISALAFATLVASATATNGTTTNTTAPTAGCWDVSVEHDATYCINGPICSGSGLEPEGSLCPAKGSVASADCHDYLASYKDGSCVLLVDATCQVIKTGAWGCVLSSSNNGSETNGTVGGGSGSVATDVTVLSADSETSDGGTSAGTVTVIAVGAACVAAVAGFALYKQYQKHSAEEAERARLETFVDVVTP